jgi:hypothetical protein
VSSCATHRRRAGSFCQERASAQTTADVLGFHPPIRQHRRSEGSPSFDLRQNAREVCVARWYDPGTEGFTSVDPDVARTAEPYACAGHDPVNKGAHLGKLGTYIPKYDLGLAYWAAQEEAYIPLFNTSWQVAGGLVWSNHRDTQGSEPRRLWVGRPLINAQGLSR